MLLYWNYDLMWEKLSVDDINVCNILFEGNSIVVILGWFGSVCNAIFTQFFAKIEFLYLLMLLFVSFHVKLSWKGLTTCWARELLLLVRVCFLVMCCKGVPGFEHLSTFLALEKGVHIFTEVCELPFLHSLRRRRRFLQAMKFPVMLSFHLDQFAHQLISLLLILLQALLQVLFFLQVFLVGIDGALPLRGKGVIVWWMFKYVHTQLVSHLNIKIIL